MRITSEEKHLYNFLRLVKDIFANSTGRTTIVGNGNMLVCYTSEYIATYTATEYQTLISEYNSDYVAYTLKQSPDKDFYLDQIEIDKDCSMIVSLAEKYDQTNNWVMDVSKDYEFKLSKIADMTQIWLKDSDVKYLDKLKDISVFLDSDTKTIITKAVKISYNDMGEEIQNMYMLAFTGTEHPNVSDSTQEKMIFDEILDDDKTLMDDDLPSEEDDGVYF